MGGRSGLVQRGGQTIPTIAQPLFSIDSERDLSADWIAPALTYTEIFAHTRLLRLIVILNHGEDLHAFGRNFLVTRWYNNPWLV